MGSLFWAIQSDSGGSPGATVASGTTSNVSRQATGLKDSSQTFIEFENTFDIPITNLFAGTYWLTLHDGPLAATDFADFYWEWSSDFGNGQEFDLIASAGWDSNFADHAFALNVPEPSSISLMLIALLVAGFGARKSRAMRVCA